MYARYLSRWLDYFPCNQLHIFDVSVDARSEVERLYEFMGVPNTQAAGDVTASTYSLLEPSTNDVGEPPERESRLGNAMNKATYGKMLDETRIYLQEFFEPYQLELCDLMKKHSCLDVPQISMSCHS